MNLKIRNNSGFIAAEVLLALTIAGMCLTPISALIRNTIVGLADYAKKTGKIFAMKNVLAYQTFKVDWEKKQDKADKVTRKEQRFDIIYERGTTPRISGLTAQQLKNLTIQQVSIAKDTDKIFSLLYKPKKFK